MKSAFKKVGQRQPADGVIPSRGVNTLGEVMDGDWYVNRQAARRLTIDELKRGPGNDRPPSMDVPWKVLVVKPFGVNPAMAAIITLTAGSSGTLMTPMAANFNLVPAALLQMKDQYGVIRFQLPYALTIWSLHVLLLWLLIRFD